MTYWGLNATFLLVVTGVVVAALLRKRPPAWGAVAATGAILIFMTAVFDNVMIGIGLVGYNEAAISGAFVGIAPLEDFAYAVAAVVLLPTLWTILGRRPRQLNQRNGAAPTQGGAT